MTSRKALVPVLVALIAIPVLLHAAGGTFALSVKRVGTKSSKEKLLSMHSLSKVRSVTIQIAVRNLTKTNATVRAEWYFIAKRARGDKLVIYSQGDKRFDLKPTEQGIHVVESDPLITNPPEYRSLNSDAEPVGYLVVAKDAEGNTSCEATQPSLMDLATTRGALDAVKKETQGWKDDGGGRPRG